MPPCIKPIDALMLACTTDIHCEFHRIRSRISSAEIHRLANSLLCQDSLKWPLVLFELQKGRSLNQLLDRLDVQVKLHGFLPESSLTLKGPFPMLSLRSLQDTLNEYRSVLRVARCIEFLGNKAWNYSLKSVTKSVLPFRVNVASLALETLGCSTKQQMKMALLDLSQRIKGCIINFLYDWENLVKQQISAQLLTFTQNAYLSIAEAAV